MEGRIEGWIPAEAVYPPMRLVVALGEPIAFFLIIVAPIWYDVSLGLLAWNLLAAAVLLWLVFSLVLNIFMDQRFRSLRIRFSESEIEVQTSRPVPWRLRLDEVRLEP